MGVVLLALFWALVIYWFFHIPSPGKSVAALAVVATVMTVRGDLSGLEKTFLTLVLFLFVFIEIKAIDKDRADNARQQREFFRAQEENFGSVTKQASNNFAETTRGLSTAIDGLNGVLGITQEVAKLSKENLENITGGDSYAYLMPEFVPGASGSSVNLFNNGKTVLTGLTVRIGRVMGERSEPENYWIDRSAIHAISMNSLGPYAHALLPDYWITPVTDGVLTTHFFAIITAQNGDVLEDIFIRPASSGNGFAFRFTVKKQDYLTKKYKTLKIVDWTEPKSL
jgi:Ca2+/Na+ antiporter